jgi:hypothetical protein
VLPPNVSAMVFFQLTIDCHDPARLARFWGQALGYQPTPPSTPDTTWWAHYRGRADDDGAFDDRLFDPDGLRPPLWFQEVPEEKAGKNRLHLDLYATGRDDTLSLDERVALVDAKVDELVALGASVHERFHSDDAADAYHFVVMNDPEGNEFCIG